MFSKKKILSIIGTRPEAIKMAPIVMQLQKEDWVESHVIVTAQHREMLDQVLQLFKITPDMDLNVMQPNQSLPDLTATLLVKLNTILETMQPDAVIAQGDTTTVFTAALACFYRNIPFLHVEAGLRSGHLRSPFPEEANRILAGRLASLHFAPTENARQNLLKEGIPDNLIYVTGNTIVDALLYISEQNIQHGLDLDPNKHLILVTAHRRENFGAPFQEICEALLTLVEERKDIQIVYPVHPNPNVAQIAREKLGNHPRIKLCSPLSYDALIAVMKQAYIILTDSGGIQEEAPILGKPVLVLRDHTERNEGIQAGAAKLVGTHSATIRETVLNLLNDPVLYQSMSGKKFLYGDGQAAQRIVKIIKDL